MRVRFFAGQWQGDEWGAMVNEDFMMVLFSIGFVFFYMWVHTGAFALAALGMTMITISLPLALALYAPFVPFFTQLHILAVFIILGVGADDIFVFVDGWRQSGRMIVPKTDDAHGRRAVLVRRMTFTYRRTASAVFNTSFTTATAFFGTNWCR